MNEFNVKIWWFRPPYSLHRPLSHCTEIDIHSRNVTCVLKTTKNTQETLHLPWVSASKRVLLCYRKIVWLLGYEGKPALLKFNLDDVYGGRIM